MSGREVDTGALILGPIDPKRQRDNERATAVHIADQVAAEHPHPLDELMPRLAGKQVAANPEAADAVRELLAALGIRPDQIRRPG